ncbi:MAG: anaerobic sulfatase maturase [Erysipelotrichaceae bacterium]|nr:anaerobic sulfatase maturase [Erysipelotrichaceae bacterium]
MKNLSLLIKPASGTCNLRCHYCFYLDELENRKSGNFNFMDENTTSNMITLALASATDSISFAFQGGEPTLAGLEYFERFVDYVHLRNTKKIPIHYSIQTNGTTIDRDWCRFLARNNFMVGISLDGLKLTHDRYRVYPDGKGSYNRVMETISLLKRYKIDFNILCVVNSENVKHPEEMFDTFMKNDLRYLQFIECLDPLGVPKNSSPFSLDPAEYGKFLVAIFDKYYQEMMSGRYVFIRYFENLMMIENDIRNELCTYKTGCAKNYVVEANGNVYPCDFYCLDELVLGNVNTGTFKEFDHKRKELKFIELSREINEECLECQYLKYCGGGCYRNIEQANGRLLKNHFCESYRYFLDNRLDQLREVLEYWQERQR